MRVFLDTSVLVAAVLEDHPAHARSFARLERVQNGADKGVVSAHSVAEVYATLTKLPVQFRHSPEQALLVVEEDILKYFELIALEAPDYAVLVREAAMARIQGGTIYDAVLLKAAAKARVDRVYTLNLKHFQAVGQGNLAKLIFEP